MTMMTLRKTLTLLALAAALGIATPAWALGGDDAEEDWEDDAFEWSLSPEVEGYYVGRSLSSFALVPLSLAALIGGGLEIADRRRASASWETFNWTMAGFHVIAMIVDLGFAEDTAGISVATFGALSFGLAMSHVVVGLYGGAIPISEDVGVVISPSLSLSEKGDAVETVGAQLELTF